MRNVFLLLLSFLCATVSGAEWDGTIMPPANPPDFVKARWEVAAKQTWFPFDKWTWAKVGLPPGLEEQVWKAWTPGAPQVWRNISPGFANVTFDAKVDSGVVTLLLDGAGLVQSTDGGGTWRALSHHLVGGAGSFQSFDISPAQPGIVVVGGSYLNRSLDGGRSWSYIYDKALPDFGYDIKTSFGAVRFNADGSRLFAGLGNYGHMFAPRGDVEAQMAKLVGRKLVYVADAKAANFKVVDLGPFAALRRIVPHPSDPDLVYASFSDGSVYRCSDARAATPTFAKLAMPASLAGLQAVSLDIAPGNPDELLLVMHGGWGNAKLIRARLAGSVLDCQEIKVGNKPGTTLASAAWNPRDASQAVVGVSGANAVYVSDDALKSFREIPFPNALKHGEGGFYSDPQWFRFDRKSDLAIAYSAIGAWASHDLFKTMDDLLMTYDDGKKLLGNKGVGFAECATSIDSRKGGTYIATNDHGAFRCDEQDLTKWRRISRNPGMPKGPKGEPFSGLAFPMGVSEDEKFVYLFARMGYLYQGKPGNGLPGPYSDDHLKLMLSADKGESWRDVTSRLGKGEELCMGQAPLWVLFDPADSRNQWLLFRKSFFRSIDGGLTFQEGSPELFGKLPMLDLVYDSLHKTLYATGGGPGVKLLRSLDLGLTWKELPIKIDPPRIANVGVLGNGDLVLGGEGRLIVMPYDKIEAGVVEPDMVRLSIGDNLGAFASAMRDFHPIRCDGKDILVFPNNSYRGSNCIRWLGPLLSTDGGKTFKWIVYDLPCLDGRKAELKDGRIIVGNTGIYAWKYRGEPLVPGDDSRLYYSDCFKVDFVDSAARFSRPGRNDRGYQHDNPGARLRFRTDAAAPTVKLRYNELHVSPSARNSVGVCLVDGQPSGTFTTKQTGIKRAVEEVDVPIKCPGEGFHDYEVVMPYGDSVDVLGVAVPEGAKFETPAPRPAKRCAFYGDSVTHGFTASSIAGTYPFRVSALNGYQMVNLGIGGRGSAAADGALLAAANCDLAVVHIGVNDWQCGRPPEGTKRDMLGFLKGFREKQPSVPLFVVTPLWVADTWIKAPKFPLEDYRKAIREAVEESGDKHAKVIDGVELIDHDAVFFDRILVHPNDAGFAQMAGRLAAAMR